ncbi:disease resistance RPP13-like protein 4 [Cryptomeria japonica]|uniref:disease resistance RPP13-like protein 4 n=1 Tax=Cryptomeria japonica TaxID=3369 RepID=UPI0027D9DB8F|nr:disease resistance RPP13-like protein 4 [Cryptomeria japonica]
MSSPVSLGDWESKLRQLKDVVGAEDYTMQILKLSYDSLPSHLKPYFAYFSFFPQDTHIHFIRTLYAGDIHQEYLIYLWIAEGFIPEQNEKEQWDTGLNYQLVNLCLVEVNSTVLFCYNVHDLLHDLSINVSKEHKCEFHLPLQERSCRRLLLGKKGLTNDAVSERPLHHHQFLRTLSLFGNPDITSIPEHPFHRLRLLRVLDLRCTAISALPKCVGKFKLLKVLNLSKTNITEVPDCVRRLKCLQFLDFSGCRNGILEYWLVKIRIVGVNNNVPTTEGDIPPAFPEKMNVMKDLQHLTLYRFLVQAGYVAWRI